MKLFLTSTLLVLLFATSLALPAARTRRDDDENDLKDGEEAAQKEAGESDTEAERPPTAPSAAEVSKSIPDAITTYPRFPEHLLPLQAARDSQDGPALTPESVGLNMNPQSGEEKAAYTYISSVNHLYNPQPAYQQMYYYQTQPSNYHHSYVVHPSEAWQANLWQGNTWQPQHYQPAYYYPPEAQFTHWPQAAAHGFTYVYGLPPPPAAIPTPPQPTNPQESAASPPEEAKNPEDREEVTKIQPQEVHPNERIEMMPEGLGEDESAKEETVAVAPDESEADDATGEERRK